MEALCEGRNNVVGAGVGTGWIELEWGCDKLNFCSDFSVDGEEEIKDLYKMLKRAFEKKF